MVLLEFDTLCVDDVPDDCDCEPVVDAVPVVPEVPVVPVVDDEGSHHMEEVYVSPAEFVVVRIVIGSL